MMWKLAWHSGALWNTDHPLPGTLSSLNCGLLIVISQPLEFMGNNILLSDLALTETISTDYIIWLRVFTLNFLYLGYVLCINDFTNRILLVVISTE